MLKKHKDEVKNILNSVDKIIRYAKKRREMAYCAVRALNDSDYYQKLYYYKA